MPTVERVFAVLGRGSKGQVARGKIERSKIAERAVSICKEKLLKLDDAAFDILEQL